MTFGFGIVSHCPQHEKLHLKLAWQAKASDGAAMSSAIVAVAPAQAAAPGRDGNDDCGDKERKVLRSALMIFRDDVIKRDRELGRRPKIASTEYWNSVKNEWASLGPERKRAYEDQAASEQDMIKAQRKRRQLAARSRSSAAGPGPPAERQPTPQLLEQAENSYSGSTIYINQALEASQMHSQLAVPAMQRSSLMVAAKSCYPLPEPLFVEYLQRNRGGIVARCNDFKEKCQKIQGGTDFPTEVTYHLHCGAVCSRTTAGDKVKFHKEIKAAFATYVSKHFKTALDVASSDVLFAIEVFGKSLLDGSPASSVTFAAMTVATGRRAQFEAEQTFVPCRVVESADEYEGFLLEYITDKIETKAKRPSNRVVDDRVLRQHDADEMAAVLMASEGFSDIDRVVLRRLVWHSQLDSEQGGLHRLQVRGTHATEPMVVEKYVDSAAAAIVDHGGGDGDGDVDFLEMLAAGPQRPRAARAPAKKVSKPKPKPDRPAEPAAAGDAASVLGGDYDMLWQEVEEAGADVEAVPVMLLLGAAELQEDAEEEHHKRGKQADGDDAREADQDSEPDSGESSASSVVGEEAPAGPQAPPVPPPGAVVDLQQLLARHGLTERYMRLYNGEKQIGRVQNVCGNFKALCACHGPDCTMWVSVSSKGLSQNRASAVMYRWLADGRAMSHKEHGVFARDLKTQLGIKTR